MKFLLLRSPLFFAVLAGAWSPSAAGSSVFHLVPKSLQKNPTVDFNIITEMTNEGRKAPQPTREAPIYYLTQPGMFIQRGHGAPAGEKPPAVERMEKVMEAALAKSGYLGATKDHPPTVVIVYSWGSHSAPADEDDSTDPTISNHALLDDMFERARLVGGEKFYNELVKAMAESGALKDATAKPRADPTGEGVPPQPNTAGEASGTMTSIFDPVERFRRREPKHESLMQDAAGSIYFVIASAFDFASAKTDSKILLWRTKMTVASTGISMPETLPALISAAGPYFGRDMTEPEIVAQKVNREGKVEIGTPTVVPEETSGKTANPAPAPAGK